MKVPSLELLLLGGGKNFPVADEHVLSEVLQLKNKLKTAFFQPVTHITLCNQLHSNSYLHNCEMNHEFHITYSYH